MADTTQRTELSTNPAVRPGWRDVYILAGLRGLSFAGDIMAATSIILFLQHDGAGSYAVMALLLAASLPPALLAGVAGPLADRFDSRKIIVTVASLQALVCLAMTLWTSPVVLIALSVLLSSGLAFTQPVFAGLPGAMVGKEHVPRATSISQTWAMAGMVAAPAVAGVLTGSFGVRIPLVLDAASFALVVLGGLVIRTRLHKNRSVAGSTAVGPRADGAKPAEAPYRVRSDRFLRSVLVLSGAVMACVTIVDVAIVFYVRDTFGASAATYGLIMSAWMLGLIPGGLLVHRVKRISHETILIGSLLCIAVGVLGAGFAPGPWWIVPFYLIGGFGNGAQATITHILLNLRVPSSHRGRAFAALGAVSNTGPAVGYFLGGAFLSFAKPRYAFLVSGGLALIVLLALSNGVRRPAGPPPDAQPDTVS
jgi:MFS family permease